MAGQRGTGANAGLLARQAAMQGGANQQAAAGQGATMQAQQSLGALGQLGGMANQQAGQQAQGLQNLNAAQQGYQSNLLNAIGQQNSAKVANQTSLNSAGAGLQQQSNSATGGLLGGAASALTGGLFAEGGMVAPTLAEPKLGPRSKAAAHFADSMKATVPVEGVGASTGIAGNAIGTGLAAGINAIGGLFKPSAPAPLAGGPMDNMGAPAAPMVPGAEVQMPMYAAKGGRVPAIVSPGEAYIPPDRVQRVAKGGNVKKEAEMIPGKASVKGDSLKNDTVPKNLEPGGIVIPRSVMQSDNPALEAHKFVAAILARQAPKKK